MRIGSPSGLSTTTSLSRGSTSQTHVCSLASKGHPHRASSGPSTPTPLSLLHPSQLGVSWCWISRTLRLSVYWQRAQVNTSAPAMGSRLTYSPRSWSSS